MIVRDYIEAIRKNGLPQIYGNLFLLENKKGERWKDSFPPKDLEGTKVVGACALGQALINLDKNHDGVFEENLDNITTSYKYERMGIVDRTVSLNDTDMLSFEQIANTLTEEYADVLDKEIPA